MWTFFRFLGFLCALLALTPDPVTSESDCLGVVTIHAGKNLFADKDVYSVDVSLWYNMEKLGETKAIRSPNPEWNVELELKEKVPSMLLNVRMVSKTTINSDTCSVTAERCSFCKCKTGLIFSRYVLYSYECKPKPADNPE